MSNEPVPGLLGMCISLFSLDDLFYVFLRLVSISLRSWNANDREDVEQHGMLYCTHLCLLLTGGGGGGCFKCNKPGHIARDCPDAAASSGKFVYP